MEKKEELLSCWSSITSNMNWANGKMKMLKYDIEHESRGGVGNEISEVIMSLEIALRSAKELEAINKK